MPTCLGLTPPPALAVGSVKSRQCEAEFSVTRTITSSDFKKLVELGLTERMGAGRSTRYRLKSASEPSTNRQVDRRNRKPEKGKGGV